MKARISTQGAQSGVMLIEALLALLIFSLGVLGIVGLQSTATKISGDSRYRSEAALMANELVGKMWAADRRTAKDFAPATPPAVLPLVAAFASPDGASYQAWAWKGVDGSGSTSAPAAGTVLRMLPGAAANQPQVVVTPVTRTVTNSSGVSATITTFQVSVTIRWQAPQEDGDGAVHNFMTVAHIGG
jgi:type IV pilus assembly protein PilV